MRATSYHVPQRFVDVVASHVVMNLINIPFLQTPIILGIHGPPGEGKTEQCRMTLRKMHVKAEWLYGDQFESGVSGEPARLLKNKYKEASDFNLNVQELYKKGVPVTESALVSVLFVNDIDQRVGRSDDLIQQTINTQLINTVLMEIADAPDKLDGYRTSRVPIILTGNNFGVLYKPLIRDGRMEKFEWQPTRDEKVAIAREMFPEEHLSNEDIQTLVHEFTKPEVLEEVTTRVDVNFSTSSFAMLRHYLYQQEVSKMIQEVGLEQIIDYVLGGHHQQRLRHPIVTLETLRNAGHELAKKGVLNNHLRS